MYPTATAFLAFLAAIPGQVAPTEERAGELLQSAIAELERRTYRKPFLATPGEREFVVPTGRRPMGILVELEAFTVLGAPTEVRVTETGKILIPGSEYALHDTGSGENEDPYEVLSLAHYPEGGRITVAATFGYTSEISADVREAIFGKAAALHASKTAGAAGAQKKIKQGPVEYELDVEAGRSGIDRWTSDFDALVRSLRRLV